MTYWSNYYAAVDSNHEIVAIGRGRMYANDRAVALGIPTPLIVHTSELKPGALDKWLENRPSPNTTMYAHNTEAGFRHVYPSSMAVKMCGGGEIVRVRIVPDPEGTHWCWHDFEKNEYRMVWQSLVQLKVCFPYGIEIEEKRRHGIRVQVRVELFPEEDPT